MSKKFKLWVSINLVGCKQETVVEFDDEDTPTDDDMLDMLWDSGMIDWGFEPIDD